MTRPYTSRETRWVLEYVRTFYAADFDAGRVAFQVPLGPFAESFTKRAAPRADAVIVRPLEVVLIEGEAENRTSALGQLLYYDFVFPLTPDFHADGHKPRRLILLVEDTEPTFELFVRKFGVELTTWAPAWLLEYLIQKRGSRRDLGQNREDLGG